MSDVIYPVRVETALTISSSVGSGGVNRLEDVRVIQNLLNANAGHIQPFVKLDVDGKVGAKTIGAITRFQKVVLGRAAPDGRVDPGKATIERLVALLRVPGGPTAPEPTPVAGEAYSHPDAYKVHLTYGIQGDRTPARTMTFKAEQLLKSILASAGLPGATLNSTLRTYHDQARITVTQTWEQRRPAIAEWYGQAVTDECAKRLNDIQGFAVWWEAYDKRRGKISSKHITNRALDVDPIGDRLKFVARVRELIPITGTGVSKIIPKGELMEPVDHVEFTFDVCPMFQ